jgi:hypothetical protein
MIQYEADREPDQARKQVILRAFADPFDHGFGYGSIHKSPAWANSDGHDTTLSEIPDIAPRTVWSGAMSRTLRNRFIEQWAGRE